MAFYQERIIDRIFDYDEDINSIDEEFKDHAKIIKSVFRDPKLLKLNVNEVVEKEEMASPPPIGFIGMEDIFKIDTDKKKDTKKKSSSINRVKVKLSNIYKKPELSPKKKSDKKKEDESQKPRYSAYVSCASVNNGDGNYQIEQRSAVHNEDGEEEYLVTRYDKDRSYAMRKHIYADGYEEIQRDYRRKSDERNIHFRDMCGIKWEE